MFFLNWTALPAVGKPVLSKATTIRQTTKSLMLLLPGSPRLVLLVLSKANSLLAKNFLRLISWNEVDLSTTNNFLLLFSNVKIKIDEFVEIGLLQTRLQRTLIKL
jgi:hypothetical protein